MTTTPFGSLFTFIRNGMNVKQDKSGDGLPITRIETISNASVNGERVGYAGLKEDDCRDWILEEGDILFSHINSVEHLGKCAVYRGVPEKLVHGMNLLCMRPDRNIIWPEYAKYLIRAPIFRSILAQSVKKAVNQASVSIGDIRKIEVKIPSLPDQHRIASILHRADVLAAKRHQALESLDEMARAVFVEMFGDPVANTPAFPRKQIKDLGQVSTGATPPSSREGMFGGNVPFVTPGDLGTAEPIRRTVTEEGARAVRTVRAGAALVCCIGTIGKIDKARERSAFNQQINAIEWNDQIDDDYGLYAVMLLKEKMVSLAASTTVPILKKSLFEQISIPSPPVALQKKFSSRIVAINELQTRGRHQAEMIDNLVSALQHRAFSGRL